MGKTNEKPAGGRLALLTPGETALRLGLSRSRVYALAAAGEIPSVKVGRAVRFEPRDVERFIREHRRGPKTAA